eukprot:4993258-Pyramimonas_sp.AAC.1
MPERAATSLTQPTRRRRVQPISVHLCLRPMRVANQGPEGALVVAGHRTNIMVASGPLAPKPT